MKEKREEKNKKEEEKAQSQSKEKDKPKNPKLEKLNTKDLNNELDLIKEGDEEEKEDDEEEINPNKKENANNESVYLLEKLDSLDESKGDNDNDNVPIYTGFSQFRNTVNSFINKKFMFPKLHNKLRDTIAIKD